MKNIMFICLGNICRSPMAEFILKDMIKKEGLDGKITVSSAATSTEAIENGIGEPVYPPAAEQLRKHGISCCGKRAVQLTSEDYGKYDVFFCMDSSNVSSAVKIFGGDPQNKVKKLLSLRENGRDVADPWYTRDFKTAFDDIYSGCAAILEEIKK